MCVNVTTCRRLFELLGQVIGVYSAGTDRETSVATRRDGTMPREIELFACLPTILNMPAFAVLASYQQVIRRHNNMKAIAAISTT